MAVYQGYRNQFTSLETGKRERITRCARCNDCERRPRSKYCGPCYADRYDERVAAGRIKRKLQAEQAK